jgi:hypothetical protein
MVGRRMRIRGKYPLVLIEKVPVLEKVSFCISFEDIVLLFTAVKYQADRLVAASKKLCLSIVGRLLIFPIGTLGTSNRLFNYL